MSDKNIFVIMPFADEFNDVHAAMRRATAAVDKSLQCKRLDDGSAAGNITDDLVEHLTSADICIADLTDNNPNVLWEVGYAMALDKPVIFVRQSLEKLPFDITTMKVLKYDRGSLDGTLVPALEKSIRDTLGKAGVRRHSRTVPLPEKEPFTIAVTGSMSADPIKCRRRVETTLTPYLHTQSTWYIGSVGTVDETVGRFLGENNQKMVCVGYGEWDVSDRMLNCLDEYGVPFVDATAEQIPKSIDGPTERDSIFMMKADLFILFWDGQSQGTLQIVEWCKKSGRDCLVAHV